MLKQVKAWLRSVVAKARAKAKAVGMSVAVAASLVLPAFAGETPSSGATGLTSVVAGADTVQTFVGQIFSLMTGNPLLCVYMAAGLFSVGIGIYIRLRRAAR